MSTRFFCDACGKEGSIWDIRHCNIDSGEEDNYDLCKACRKKVKNFIKSLSKKEKND